MIGAFFTSLTLMLLVLLIPFMQVIFKITSMDSTCWFIVIGLAIVPLIVMEAYKGIKALFKKN